MKVVVDSTPLIALSLIDKLSLLREIFTEIIIPKSVFEEVAILGEGRPGSEEVKSATWLTVSEPQDRGPLPPSLLGLHTGEMDVILLAKELDADYAIIDERLGRRVAKALGLKVKGTLGVLLAAYQSGLISREEAEKIVEELANSFIRIRPLLVKWFRSQL